MIRRCKGFCSNYWWLALGIPLGIVFGNIILFLERVTLPYCK